MGIKKNVETTHICVKVNYDLINRQYINMLIICLQTRRPTIQL